MRSARLPMAAPTRRILLSTTIALGMLCPGAGAQLRPDLPPPSLVARPLLPSVTAFGPLGAPPAMAPLRSSPRASALIPTARQERRRPVYDDTGEVIHIEEIAMGVDESGLSGAFWGGSLGLGAGALLGAAIISCGERRANFQHYCSPREEALQNVLPLGLGITFGLVGAWLGWEGDVTTWDESLEEIRRRRRVGR